MNQEYPYNPNASERRGAYNGEKRFGGGNYSDELLLDQQNQHNEVDLKYLIQLPLRYKWWVLSITLLVTYAAYLYSQSLESIYISSGTILIAETRNREDGVDSNIAGIVNSAFEVATSVKLANEIQLLQSRRLAGEIARKLMAQDTMKNGKRFPILHQEYGVDSTMVTSDVLTLRIHQRMRMDKLNRDANVIGISYSSISPLEAADLVNKTIDTYTEISTTQHRMAANSALDFLKQEQQAVGDRLQHSEEVFREYMNRANIVHVDEQTNSVINRLAELESQRQEVQVELTALNSSIEAYENLIEQIRPGLTGHFVNDISSGLKRNQFQLSELATERTLLLQRNPSLRDNPTQEPQLVRINEKITAVKSEISQLVNDLFENEPEIFIGSLSSEDEGVTNRLAEVNQKLTELRIRKSQLHTKADVLDRRLNEENQFFNELPENMTELARLKRNHQVNKQLYSAISDNYMQITLWKQSQFGAGRPLDYAYVPDIPSGPNRPLHILIGFLAGALLSTGFVFVRENVNRRVNGTEDLGRLGYPLLAVIPDVSGYVQKHFDGKKKVEINGRFVSTDWTHILDSNNPIADSYRRLHYNIVYSDPDISPKIIFVTSSMKGEGKTTVSINLACTLAESGKKVLVVDTDLRRPNIHKITGEEKKPGIGEIFYNQWRLENVIRPTAAPGVDVLTAGREIPNPPAVLKSNRMTGLFREIRQKYDHVIIDTPPFGIAIDAAPILSLAEAVVLVTMWNRTEIKLLNHTVSSLKRMNAHILGTVITAFNYRKSTDDYPAGYPCYNAYKKSDNYHL